MIPRKVISCGHILPPLLVGLCIGVVLNLVSLPFVEEDCENPVPDSELGNLAVSQSRKTNALDSEPVSETVTQKTADILKKGEKPEDFEPQWVTSSPKDYVDKKFSTKKFRPRYAATELGIREKLFLSFFTSVKTVNSLAVAVNRTMPVLNSFKTAFFMGPKDEHGTLPEGMSLVSFSTHEVSRQSLPFHSIKFIAEHYGNAYDWFAFFPDSTYVRGEKLFNFVSDLSIANNLFLGEKLDSSKQGADYCTANGGFIISNSILMSMASSLDWCLDHATSVNDGENIGRCVEHVSGVKCTSVVKGMKFQYHDIGKTGVDSILKDKHHLDPIHDSLTVYPFSDATSIYKMHRYICHWEINETEKEIELLKKEIEGLSVHVPDGPASLTWPIGAEPPFEPHQRYMVLRWTYFTEKEIYFKDEKSVASPLTGPDKEDVADIIERVKRVLSSDSRGVLEYSRLINGYRRFDPTRGMEYILDVMATDKQSGKIRKKRVEILKPLGDVEIVPMPYVTENSRVNLILPVTVETKNDFSHFMEKFAKTFLEIGENVYLFIAFLYKPGLPLAGKSDQYLLPKSLVRYYENKYRNSAKIFWTNVQLDSDNIFLVLEQMGKKLMPESLIFLCTPGTDFDVDFINRVRMNTIQKTQVYFPIAFWQYKPNFVYDKIPYPDTIEISDKYGIFDGNAFSHASFYLRDYTKAYAEARRLKKDLTKMDLYDLFLQCHKLHVFRATEPNLRLHYKEWHCDPESSEDEYHRCLQSRATGLASNKVLAKLVLLSQQEKNKDPSVTIY